MKTLSSATQRALPAIAVLGATLLATAPHGHAESLRLDNAIVHTVSGPSLTNTAVLIRDGRIAAIGAEASAASADRTISLEGLHLFPGLIAPGTILGLIEIDAIRPTRDTTEVGEFTPDVHSWIAVNPESELIPVARANGYTHAQAIPLGGIVSGHSSLIRLNGWTIEDLADRRTAALHLFWPSFSINTSPRPAGGGGRDQWKSPEDQVRERDQELRKIDAFFDEASAYAAARRAAGLGSMPPLSVEAAAGRKPSTVETNGFTIVPAWESMLPLLNGEVPLFLHADDSRQIRSGVEWAVRRKFRTVLAGGLDAARVAPLCQNGRSQQARSEQSDSKDACLDERRQVRVGGHVAARPLQRLVRHVRRHKRPAHAAQGARQAKQICVAKRCMRCACARTIRSWLRPAARRWRLPPCRFRVRACVRPRRAAAATAPAILPANARSCSAP
jgi:hypothetical protein